jgi:hypothetical protein
MAYGKKPGYASSTSQRFWCPRCRCYRYGQLIQTHRGVPGLPGADPNREIPIGKTTQCDKCGYKNTEFIDD